LTGAGETQTTFVRVARRRDVSNGPATIVRAGRYEVAIFDVGGELRAYENCCPHQGGPIGEGIVEGETVTCPWHAWSFDLRDGKMTLGDFAALRRFEVRVEGDAICVSTEPVNQS
jgi:nitrite reductase (NADH) small subunit